MATRKFGKSMVKMVGGPFHGSTFPMSADGKSFVFKCKEYVGHYEFTPNYILKWICQKPIKLDLSDDVEHCAILGYN